jgi:hypothetical protein
MMVYAATLLLAARLTAAQPDACQVLNKADLAAVQGEAFTSTKLSPRDGGTQCFYQLPTFTKSVSVDVRYRGARKFWDDTFEHEREHEAGEADEKVTPPVKVRGVGSEAMWVSSRVAGSLYVRKGDSLLRVSVGGPGDTKEKIARSKQLALRALRRM